MTGCYDHILRLIPLTFFGIIDTLTIAGSQLTTAVPIVADAAALLTDHALFVNGPSSPSPSRLNEHAGPNVADMPSSSTLDVD